MLFIVARRGMRKAIWRLRNRLIAAYLFIAVVPIVLILTLVGIGTWLVIGEMATYLVNTELHHRESGLARQAEVLARVPVNDAQAAIDRFTIMARTAFPAVELLVSGTAELRYPANNRLTQPPAAWKRTSGLVLKKEGSAERLYAWAHDMDRGQNVTVMAPITPEVLTELVPGLGDVAFAPLMDRPRVNHVPERHGALDFPLRGYYRLEVPYWHSPQEHRGLILLVDTRASAVLGTVFQTLDWAELWLTLFVVVSVIFLIVELVSLVAGVQLSRSITGAVHELYEGTQRVKDGRFQLLDSGEGQRPACRTGQVVQHHDGQPGPADHCGQGEGATGIRTDDRPRSAAAALPQGRSVHQDAGVEGRVQPGADGFGRLLRFHGDFGKRPGLRHRRCGRQGDLGGAADGDHPIHHADAVGSRQWQRPGTIPPRRWSPT